MTFAELVSTSPVERWRALDTAQQEGIGVKAIGWNVAELVADDDGLKTTEVERNAASKISDHAFQTIDEAVRNAFPQIEWAYPEGTFYELCDRFGSVIGTVDAVGFGYRFCPTLPRVKRRSAIKHGVAWDAVPRWARRVVSYGGRFGVVRPEAPFRRVA